MSARTAGLVAALLALPACQGPGVPRSELSAEPMALVWYDEGSARRRAEALEAELGAPQPKQEPESRSTNRAVAEVGAIADYVQGLLAVEGEASEEKGRLVLLEPRSGDIEPIAGALAGAVPMQWSPDHRRLLFAQVRDAHPKLYEFDREDGGVHPLTHGGFGHPEGCYGPDGSVVVTEVDVSRGERNARVVLLGAGGRRRVLSPPGRFASFPTCSPDGSVVAFVTSDRGRSSLASIRTDGEEPARLLGRGRDPQFSPDGEWIVYTARDASRAWELWRVRPDGSGRARIGRGRLDEMRPTVSPDGQHVVYVAERNFRTYLYLRRFDGSGDRILLGSGSAERPVW